MSKFPKIAMFTLFLTLFWAPNAMAYDLPVQIDAHNTVIKAVADSGHVYLQLRPILESKDYEVSYNSQSNVITASRSYTTTRGLVRSSADGLLEASGSEDLIVMSPGSPAVTRNSTLIALNYPVKSIDGNGMIPLELVSRLDNGLDYEGGTLYIRSARGGEYSDVNDELLREIKYNGRLDQEHVLSWENRINSQQSAWMSRDEVLAMDLTIPSAITAYELDSYFAGSSLAGTGAAFIQAEIDYGVNAVFLAALAVHESGFGTSAIARNKCNLFGWGASDGNAYGGAVSFGSYEECINQVGAAIASQYLSPEGRYYSGPTLPGVNRIYCTTSQWSYDVASLMLKINLAAVESTPGI